MISSVRKLWVCANDKEYGLCFYLVPKHCSHTEDFILSLNTAVHTEVYMVSLYSWFPCRRTQHITTRETETSCAWNFCDNICVQRQYKNCVMFWLCIAVWPLFKFIFNTLAYKSAYSLIWLISSSTEMATRAQRIRNMSRPILISSSCVFVWCQTCLFSGRTNHSMS